MSSGSLNKPPSMKSTQLQTSSLPPTWEVFSTIDQGKQQTIYRTMCDQIQSQQKQLVTLVEKAKQQDLLASQKLGDSKMIEDMKRMRFEIEQLQTQIVERDSKIQQLEQDLEQKQQQITQMDKIFRVKQNDLDKLEQLQKLNDQQQLLLSGLETNIQDLKQKNQSLAHQLKVQELQYDDQIKKLENDAYRQNILIDQQQQDQEEIKFNYQNLQRNYDILNDRINQNKDFKLFEQIHEQMNTEFQTIKNNYKSLQDKIKQQEAQIEGLVAENSRLLIDLYNYQL
ncbi:hypothetical protein pb186bvf_009750 [Paramecium bursaria]